VDEVVDTGAGIGEQLVRPLIRDEPCQKKAKLDHSPHTRMTTQNLLPLLQHKRGKIRRFILAMPCTTKD